MAGAEQGRFGFQNINRRKVTWGLLGFTALGASGIVGYEIGVNNANQPKTPEALSLEANQPHKLTRRDNYVYDKELSDASQGKTTVAFARNKEVQKGTLQMLVATDNDNLIIGSREITPPKDAGDLVVEPVHTDGIFHIYNMVTAQLIGQSEQDIVYLSFDGGKTARSYNVQSNPDGMEDISFEGIVSPFPMRLEAPPRNTPPAS